MAAQPEAVLASATRTPSGMGIIQQKAFESMLGIDRVKITGNRDTTADLAQIVESLGAIAAFQQFRVPP
jgi:hypothetical protein